MTTIAVNAEYATNKTNNSIFINNIVANGFCRQDVSRIWCYVPMKFDDSSQSVKDTEEVGSIFDRILILIRKGFAM